MPKAYSNDLRRKFLQAYDEGEGTLEELAELVAQIETHRVTPTCPDRLEIIYS